MVIVELQELRATQRFARPEIRQAHSPERVELCLVADEQPAQEIHRSAAQPLAGLAEPV